MGLERYKGLGKVFLTGDFNARCSTENDRLDFDMYIDNDSYFDYFHLFIVATSCPSERRPQKTVSCYRG